MKRTILAAAMTTALGLALPVTGTGASAEEAEPTAPGDVVSKRAATTKAGHDRIVDYWTRARMRTAVPADTLVSDRDVATAGGRVATGAPRVVGGQATQARRSSTGHEGGYYGGGGKVRQTTGKVFFTLSGSNYVCSGSSVSAANRDLVLTAGHCLNEGAGSFATNFAFVPAYDDGARPYGTFTARRLVTTSQWSRQGDLDYDVGFAVMNPVNGVDLANRVGSQGIGFNLPRGEYVHSFGYPQASPYDGSDIAWCHGKAVKDTYGGSPDQGLDCNMTGGSSGGPWFRGYATSTGAGTLNSVNSFKYTGGPLRDHMFGPYFGSVAQNLHASAQTL